MNVTRDRGKKYDSSILLRWRPLSHTVLNDLCIPIRCVTLNSLSCRFAHRALASQSLNSRHNLSSNFVDHHWKDIVSITFAIGIYED